MKASGLCRKYYYLTAISMFFFIFCFIVLLCNFLPSGRFYFSLCRFVSGLSPSQNWYSNVSWQGSQKPFRLICESLSEHGPDPGLSRSVWPLTISHLTSGQCLSVKRFVLHALEKRIISKQSRVFKEAISLVIIISC